MVGVGSGGLLLLGSPSGGVPAGLRLDPASLCIWRRQGVLVAFRVGGRPLLRACHGDCTGGRRGWVNSGGGDWRAAMGCAWWWLLPSPRSRPTTWDVRAVEMAMTWGSFSCGSELPLWVGVGGLGLRGARVMSSLCSGVRWSMVAIMAPLLCWADRWRGQRT
jgi:hypothetical protein